MLRSNLDLAHRAAVRTACALRGIFNDCGNLKEVRDRFDAVESFVSYFEGLDPGTVGKWPGGEE